MTYSVALYNKLICDVCRDLSCEGVLYCEVCGEYHHGFVCDEPEPQNFLEMARAQAREQWTGSIILWASARGDYVATLDHRRSAAIVTLRITGIKETITVFHLSPTKGWVESFDAERRYAAMAARVNRWLKQRGLGKRYEGLL